MIQEGDGKQEQIEDLSEGEHSDNDPSLQPARTYRHGLNGNLISRDGRNYTYESQKGTVISFVLPTHKAGSMEIFVPMGFIPLGQYMLVLSTNRNSMLGVAGGSEIGLVSIPQGGAGTAGDYIALYYHDKLAFDQNYQVGEECLGLCENDNLWRAYWTDVLNQPRSFNAKNPILYTQYSTSDVLVVGQKYMVVTDSFGSVKYNGVVYGPLQTAGNIFTCIAGVPSFVSDTGIPRVIKAINPLLFDYTPQKSINTIKFLKYGTDGQVNCGAKLYAYQLYTNDGYESSWTPTENPVLVAQTIPTDIGWNVNYYHGSGYNVSVNSQKSITLEISNIPIDLFNKIRVAVIEIDQEYNVPTMIEVFADTDITAETMQIVHYGQEDLAQLLLADLEINRAVVATCKTLATDKQRQVISNLSTVPIVIQDTNAITVTPFAYKFPIDTSRFPNDYYTPKVLQVQPSAATYTTWILPDGIYVVIATNPADYIEYPLGSGNNYYDGATFVGEPTSTACFNQFGVHGSTVNLKACIRKIKYYKYNPISLLRDIPVYDIIELNDEFWGYTSMAFCKELKGVWCEETYRTGRLFIDLFGNPMFVQFVKDVTIPSQSDASGDYKLLHLDPDNNDFASSRAIGLQFDNIDITDIKDKIGGIMMVRVKRDKQIFAQGLLHQCVRQEGVAPFGSAGDIVPISNVVPVNDKRVALRGDLSTFGNYYCLFSPELDFGLPDKNPLQLLSGDGLKGVADYTPRDTRMGCGDAQFTDDPYDYSYYSKFYIHNNFDNADTSLVNGLNKLNIVRPFNVNETMSLDGVTPFRNDFLWTTYPGATWASAGPKTVVVTDKADFVNTVTGKGTGVNGASDRLTMNKVLVNYIRPKAAASLYGGTSDTAKANNLYQSCGHYLPITDQLLSDIYDPINHTYILDGLQVFGGDCFVNIYDRVHALWNTDASGGSYDWGFMFPCESEINVALREGGCMSNISLVHFNGIHFKASYDGDVTFTQRLEEFLYNKAYSSENNLLKYAALPVDYVPVSRFPYRNRFSEIKQLGEKFDNMRKFLLANFKDVDATHGEITKSIVINDYFFNIQERGVTYLPIDERELISGSIAGATQLGVGGVMERFDTKDMFYGTQHKHSVLKTEDGFMFVDWRRLAILSMKINEKVVDLTITEGKQSYLYLLKELSSIAFYLPIDGNDNPLTGAGVLGYYDPRTKTAFFTFKWWGIKTDTRLESGGATIAISTIKNKVIGNFSFTPGIVTSYFGYLLGVDEVSWTFIIDGYDYTIEDTVTKGGIRYVCYKAFTASSPIVANEQPDYPNSIYWKKMTAGNQVSLFWLGDICKFFGKVYPFELIKVFGSNSVTEDKAFDVIEAYGNDTPFTDVYHSTSKLSSSDTNISSKNKNFSYVNNAWWFNVALSKGKQRLVDRYMETKLVVKNYLTDPTVSLNKVKRIVYLRIINRKKE